MPPGTVKEKHMKPLSHARSAAVCICAAALMATAASACSANNSAGTSGSAASGGTLTIQGDTGNPSLVENFNPFTPSTELHGAFLIYEPLEIPSPVNGAYTPFLATGYKFTNPTTLVYTIRSGVKWSDGTAFTARRRGVHVQPAEEVPGAGHHRGLGADLRRLGLGQ